MTATAMTGFGVLIALLAGIVSFASPCCLPLVPVYVSYLVGTSEPDPSGLASPGPASPGRGVTRAVALRHALVFVAGFTTVFVALWASVGFVGYLLQGQAGVLRVLGGAVLIVFGLHTAGLVEISVLYRQLSVPLRAPGGGRLHTVPSRPGYGRSALLGVAFAAGWTPCVGPILGGIIGLASVSRTAVEGTVLLIAYALGLGIPFVLVALGTTEISRRLGLLRRHRGVVNAVTGAALIGTGFLLITNRFVMLSGTLPTFGL